MKESNGARVNTPIMERKTPLVIHVPVAEMPGIETLLKRYEINSQPGNEERKTHIPTPNAIVVYPHRRLYSIVEFTRDVSQVIGTRMELHCSTISPIKEYLKNL